MDEEQEKTAPLEAESLQDGWAAKASARPRCHAYLAVGAKTDLGQVRENNEDKFDFLEPDDPPVLATKGRVYAVADGMGGHSAGQIASELSLKVFIRSYYSDTNANVEQSLARAVREANAYVVDVARAIPGRSGMGATLTAAVVRDDDVYIAQVGDSRCYLLRDGGLEQITEDHSWVAEQVRAGALTEAEAEMSPFRNVITRSMGGAAEVEPDLVAVKAQPGDRFLLCSDGLSGMVTPEELRDLLSAGSPSVAAWKMIDRANEQGGKDNITALIFEVLAIEPWPEAEEAESEAEADGEAEEDPSGSETLNGHKPEADPSQVSPDGDGPTGEARKGLLGKLFHRA